MAEVIGAAILTSLGATAVGTTAATVVGSIVLTGALVGAQLLLAPNAGVPKPADGKIQVRQAIPPPIYGYGESRSAGVLVASEMQGSTSYDVLAFQDGRTDSFRRFYLHEDLISFDEGEDGYVAPLPGARYAGGSSRDVQIYWRKGETPETAYSQLAAALPEKWTAAHRGDGVASALVICSSPDAKVFGNRFPFGLPKLGVVNRWRWVWDFRDAGQDPADEATWAWSDNPILHLLHHRCHCLAGFGLAVEAVYQPYAGFWIAAADRCDELVPIGTGGTEKRYVAGGTYNSETPRKGVQEALLRSCDGWMSEAGDGGFVVYAGAYYEPDLVITDAHVVDDDIKQCYLEDEKINELVVKVTSSEHDYNEVEADPWSLRDEIDAGAIVVRAEAKAEWCPQWRQARRLAKIEIDKKRAKLRGTLVLNLYGENLRRRRYFMLNLRDRMSTRMVPCEVVDLVDESFGSGTFRCEFRSVRPGRYDWTVAEEGAPPPITDNSEAEDLPTPNLPTLAVVRETIAGVPTARISATNPPVEGWPELGLTGWFRKSGDTAWRRMATPEDARLLVLSDLVADGSYEVQTAYTGAKGGEGERSPVAEIGVLSDDVAPAAPIGLRAERQTGDATVLASARSALNEQHIAAIEIRRRRPGEAPGAAVLVAALDTAANEVKSVLDTPGAGVWVYDFYARNRSGLLSPAATSAEVVIPGVVFSDDFNRADGPYAGQLTRSGGNGQIAIVSNELQMTSGGTISAFVFPRLYSPRHFAQATVRDTVANVAYIVAVRAADNNNFIGVRHNGTSYFVLKREAGGAVTSLGVITMAQTAGDVVRLEADGTNVRLSINGGTPQTFAIGASGPSSPLLTADLAGCATHTAGTKKIDNLAAGVLA